MDWPGAYHTSHLTYPALLQHGGHDICGRHLVRSGTLEPAPLFVKYWTVALAHRLPAIVAEFVFTQVSGVKSEFAKSWSQMV